MKRTMFFKCSNCNAIFEIDHPIKFLSRDKNNGIIFIADDKKIWEHDCGEKDTMGIAYLMKVMEED